MITHQDVSDSSPSLKDTTPKPILWYTKSASDTDPDPNVALQNVMEYALPIGNGRLGALAGGDPQKDFLYVTEGTMWLGGRNETMNGGEFFYGDQNQNSFGSLIMLAKVYINLDHNNVQNYKRALDLTQACVDVEYQFQNVTYQRTVCASYPDDVIAVHLSIKEGTGSYTGTIELQGTRGESIVEQTANSLYFTGTLPYGTTYAARVCATASGKSLTVDNGKISFEECTEIILVFSGGTNYKYQPATSDPYNFIDTSVDPLTVATTKGNNALGRPIKDLFADHVADYQKSFNTMQVNLGVSSDDQRALDTETRIDTRANQYGNADPEFEATYLQFGRYLMISSSRNSLPINLQGLWLNNSRSDKYYRTDSHLEMNYWLSDRAALNSCFQPLKNYCLNQLASWQDITKSKFNDSSNPYRNSNNKLDGWATGFYTNIYGGNGWRWHPAGNAWICNTLWQHYEYTLDKEYLQEIYPLFKGACDFWKSRLISATIINLKTGQPQQYWIDDVNYSPEHGPDKQGNTYSQEWVWDLFTNYLSAADVVGETDQDYIQSIRSLLSQLYLPQTDPITGCLQEWQFSSDPATGQLSSGLATDNEYFLSPLVGIFPGDRIRGDQTPDAGTINLLISRSPCGYGWPDAWRALCWARLKQTNNYYNTLILGLSGYYLENCLGDSYNSPLNCQVTRNSIIPVAMLEAILYSRVDLNSGVAWIELLPTLPQQWSESGNVTGIGARGGFSIDISWSKGQPTDTYVRRAPGVSENLALKADIVFGATTQSIALNSGQDVVHLSGPGLTPVNP